MKSITENEKVIIFKPNWIDQAVKKFEEHATKNATMLEWGSGLSTPFLADRVKHIYAIEHNHLWFTKVSRWTKDMPNVNLYYRPYPPDVSYINAPYELGKRFEIIEIDGRLRNLCFQVALNLIVENGIIIFDDIQETTYAPTRENFLKQPPWVNHTQIFSGRPGGKATAIYHHVNPKTY